MKKNYEAMIIISSKIADADRTELVKKFSKMASSSTTVEKWGVKKFAYPIEYRNEGYYFLMHFAAEPSKIEEMTKLMNITDGIVRFMFVAKSDKQLAADAARKAAKKARDEAMVSEKPAAAE